MPSASNAAPPGRPALTDDLRVKLVWVTVFRTVATTLLLATIGIRQIASARAAPLTGEEQLPYIAIAGVYLLTLFYGLVLRRGGGTSKDAYVQVFGDVVVATGLVYLTGGGDSPFTFAFSLAVIEATILLYRRGAIVAAVASTAAYSALLLAIQAGWLAHGDVQPLSTSRLIFALASHALAQFLVAVLASYLAQLLFAAGGELDARRADLAHLSGLHQQILACMPSGLITCDPTGRVTFVNPAAAAILETTTTQDLHLDALLPRVFGVASFGERREVEVPLPSGTKVLGLTVTPLEADVGSLLIVFQDLTRLRRMEAELRRADQLAALGRLSAQLAHEIKNPLASMRGAAQLLSADLPDAGSARMAKIVVRESDRLAGLVDSFLKFARPAPPSVRRCDVGLLVAETLEILGNDPLARGVRLERALDPVEAEVDPDQLRQIVVNLVRNALAAAQPGGVVRVSVARDGDGVSLRVWDSAGAIAPEHLARLFEPFFTTRAGGTGLGLSVTHGIVLAHGGSVRVSSSPARGTEFVVWLPRTKAEVSLAPTGS